MKQAHIFKRICEYMADAEPISPHRIIPTAREIIPGFMGVILLLRATVVHAQNYSMVKAWFGLVLSSTPKLKQGITTTRFPTINDKQRSFEFS